MAGVRENLYPEVNAGGFTRADSTVAFFTRVNALLRPEMTVLDFGAGRGQFMDKEPTFRQGLQNLRGKVNEVVGLDIDPVVIHNQSLDRAVVIDQSGSWPVPDRSVDLVVSDWTFEHVDNPMQVGAEAARVVRPGGWVCARTPNKHGYIAWGSRIVPQRLHGATLARVQPLRQSRDVFPTRYELNTVKDVGAAFPDFDVHHYTVSGEPAYFGRSSAAWRAAQFAHRLLPPALHPISLFFLRRKG